MESNAVRLLGDPVHRAAVLVAGSVRVTPGVVRRRVGFRKRSAIMPAAMVGMLALGQAAGAASLDTDSVALRPMVLSDAKLDAVTASGITASFTLMATASGANVSTSTTGSVRTAQTSILMVDVGSPSDPSSPESRPVRLVREVPADLLFAAGSATAKGDSNAQCSVTLNTPSTFAYFRQMTDRSITSTFATCACSAFGISTSP